MPLSLYGSRSAALDSLREDDLGEVLPLVAEADRLAASQAWWASIRRVLSSDPALSAGDLSRSIGWSERTLQRRLEAAGSSFRQERHRARMEMAVELLSVGHDKVASIAKATGFASESQFCRAFRAYAGQTPSELRQASERAAESQLAATEARAS
jgi:AraC-like DNA-binding protein